jgi:hypothetical protein
MASAPIQKSGPVAEREARAIRPEKANAPAHELPTRDYRSKSESQRTRFSR